MNISHAQIAMLANRAQLYSRGGMGMKRRYPAGAVLHYDAALGSELTGNNPFLTSVLGPQYSHTADGTPVSIGAAGPVDRFSDGFVGYRSCGQVTNLYLGASSAVQSLTPTTNADGSITYTVGSVGIYCFARNESIVTTQRSIKLIVSGNVPYIYFRLPSAVWATVKLSDASVINPSVTSTISARIISGGKLEIIITNTLTITNIYEVNQFGPARNVTGTLERSDNSGILVGDYITIHSCVISSTAYLVPYVPPGVTQPSTFGSATGGAWFSLPVGSPAYNALTGVTPVTLSELIKMGIASTDLALNTVYNIKACDDVATSLLRMYRDASGNTFLQLYDGVNLATVPCTWSRGDVLQINAQAFSSTQMKIGFRNITLGQLAFTWGSVATYRGTFAPDASLQRLMFGFGDVLPIYYGRSTLWPFAETDANVIQAAA